MDVIAECMKMTSFGGQAKSLAMRAIKDARQGDQAAADKDLEEAQLYLDQSHEAHTVILTATAATDEENPTPVTFFMVHAANHLSSADTVLLLARELVHLYKKE